MKQRFYFSIASGSTGNSGLYVCGGSILLIDMGISVRKLRQALARFAWDISDLDAILLTHEHHDHVKGLATFCKKYTVPIYATQGTIQAVQEKIPDCAPLLHSITEDESFAVGDLQITAFATSHDAAQSCGYYIESIEGNFGYCTDLGYLSEEIQSRLMQCDAMVLESNHDSNMLMAGPYPYALKQRVKGQYGHLSNAECAACVVSCVQAGTSTVILSHLSEKNNTPFLAFQQTNMLLQENGLSCALFVAPKEEMQQPILLERKQVQVCCL